MYLDRPERVRRAARVIAAHVPIKRADQQTIELEQTNEYVLHRAPPSRSDRRLASRDTTSCQADPRSAGTSAGSVAALGRARTTRSIPTGVFGTCARARWRSRRLTRLRVTAFPSAPLTTNPMRGPERPVSTVSETTPTVSETTPSGACTAWTTSVGRLTRIPRLVVRRKSLELCILSNRGNTVVAQARMSGRQAAAALAAPGGNDGAAGTCPHPQTKAMGAAAAPIARLECALGHGKTPTIFGVLDNQVRCSRGTHRRRSGQVAAVAISDLLTVRGAAKPVKPTRTRGD